MTNKAFFCLLAALVLTGCNKPASEDSDSTPAPPKTSATPKAATASAAAASTVTPKATDWMWKNAKGTPRNKDPFAVPDDPLSQKAKK